MIEHLKETRGKVSGEIQAFASEAIIEKVEKENPSNQMMKFVKATLLVDRLKSLQDSITKSTAFINFYGSYSDKNREKMLGNLKESDEETKNLLVDVFKSGKDSASMVKPLLKSMLKTFDEIKNEIKKGMNAEELQIGKKRKHSKEWYLREARKRGFDKLREELEEKENEKQRERIQNQEKLMKERQLRQRIKKDPLYGLQKDQKEYVMNCSKEEGISLLEARKVLDGAGGY